MAKKTKYYNDYEHYRWFERRRSWEGYRQTYHSIEYHLKKMVFNDVIEVGVGSGIWTRMLFRKNPKMRLDIVDISERNLNETRCNLGERKNIRYFLSDFLDFKPDKKYDLFFSIRALRFIKDKEKFMKKVYDMLSPGGTAFVMTKMPNFYEKSEKQGNRHPIWPEELKVILEKIGFKDIRIYPVQVRIPFLRLYSLDNFLWRRRYKKDKMPWNKLLVGSYLVRFKRP